MSNFGAILTNAGAAKLANAIALGVPLKLTQMGVGDGNGQPVAPDPAMTAIPGEKRRAAINTLFADPLAASQLVAEQIIPEDVGGWWIRCVGLYDDSNTLIAIANVPDTYKPLLTSGAGRTQIIRMVLIVSDTSAVELKIDPSVVLATRKYVDEVMKAHKESRDHPAATESGKGFIEIASQEEACEAKSGELAVPPKYLPAVIAKYAPVTGGYRKLKLSADGASANVLITADQLVLDSVGTAGPLLAKAISVTAVTSKSGANGIDTGSVAASTWYSVWVISNGANVASLLSLSDTSPAMPDGYTHRRRVGWIRTDATANKYPLRFSQNGDTVTRRLAAGANMTSNIVMATGVQGAVSGTGVTVALGGFIPQTADEVRVVLSTQTAIGGVVQVGLHGSLLENAELSVSGSVNQAQQANIQLEPGSSSIVFASNITLGVMYLRGWRDSL